jgi:hypothetical protein
MDRVAAAQQDLPPALPPSTLPTSLFDLVGRESSSKDQSKRGKKMSGTKGWTGCCSFPGEMSSLSFVFSHIQGKALLVCLLIW